MTAFNSKLTRRGFLKRSLLATGLALATGLLGSTAVAAVGDPEKEDRKFGFIKLTDMAPLAVA